MTAPGADSQAPDRLRPVVRAGGIVVAIHRGRGEVRRMLTDDQGRC